MEMTLNMNGFQELSFAEMQAVEGGGWYSVAAIAGGGILVAGGFVVTVAGAATLNGPAFIGGLGAMGAGINSISSGYNNR